jgi:hypothetical protein
MKTVKHVLRPERVRQVPEQFSWVDQALVQRHLIDRCDARSSALYLFLVTVADAQGLSYYASATIAARLHLGADELVTARAQLLELDLIAYQPPLYQVLSLTDGQRVPPCAPRPPARTPGPRQTSAAPVSLAQLLELEQRHARL